ncbi:MAG: ribonucleoside-diphosphate reductase subunit alpha [Zetaproteobacteria bacterium]|nr:ribonucleoside-diphosphate reductase subunit alpha [Pseudobdellovibrionaceae bacterium]
MSLVTNYPVEENTNESLILADRDKVKVKKRDGSLQPVAPEMITNKVRKHADGLPDVDPVAIATKAINGIYDGVTTEELDQLLMQNSAMLIGEDPQYSKLAARLLNEFITDEVQYQKIYSFSDSITHGFRAGILSTQTMNFVEQNKAVLNQAIMEINSDLFEYFGLRTIYDRYLLKDPESRLAFEKTQYFFMRVACGLAQTAEEAIEFYHLISTFQYMPSTPTLFNSGTNRPQMSSCYLLDSPQDNLEAIYDKYRDIAMLSKFAGGIGIAYHRVRSRGSLIRGTNGRSNGVIPFLKTLDSSVSAVNQGGKRKGAACVYLETWHADILAFLSLRDNTGDEAQRTHNLNLANWIPDLFMKRVEKDQMWSLFDPADVPSFPDIYGEEFEIAYAQAEAQGLFKDQIKARDLYGAMMKTLAETGNGWMTFKDASNTKANQTLKKTNVIHLSNLCTEIIEVTSAEETAVCNLGSLNLSRYIKGNDVDYEKLAQNVKTAVKYLDRVVDINFYPIDPAKSSNHRWRPIGLGLMGLQDAFFKLGLAFDDPKAKEVSRRVQEEIYLAALEASCDLSTKYGPHDSYEDTRVSQGQLQFDLWGIKPSQTERWEKLKKNIKAHGLRNSLMIAIAPTATIASIVGSYECIEPQISNLFKRETLSGEFLQVNTYLIKELKDLGLWTQKTRDKIKLANGSIQGIEEIPKNIKERFRTAWEIPMRSLIDMAADRGAYIDQSQSLNLFLENPTIGKVSSMYNYAWKKGLKTTYYLRSRAATQIRKTTVSNSEAVACSLENPDACESCQ